MFKNLKMNPLGDVQNKVRGNNNIESTKLSKYLLTQYIQQIFNLHYENFLLKLNNENNSLKIKFDQLSDNQVSTIEHLQDFQ